MAYRLEICSNLPSTYRRAAASFAEPARKGCDLGCGRLDGDGELEKLLGAGDGRDGGRKPPSFVESAIF